MRIFGRLAVKAGRSGGWPDYDFKIIFRNRCKSLYLIVSLTGEELNPEIFISVFDPGAGLVQIAAVEAEGVVGFFEGIRVS